MDRFELRRQNYDLDEDQASLQDAFRSFFTKEVPSSVVRGAEPLGFDERLWTKVLAMDVLSMSLPASVGGDDATLVELVLVAEELGRTLAPVPLISQVVSTRLLVACAAETALLTSAREGSRRVALALRPIRPGAPQLVPDAAIAHEVIGLEAEELVLYRHDAPASHVRNQGSTPLAWWTPEGAAERVVLDRGAQARARYATALDEWKLLTAAALIGLTDSALTIAVAFAKTRETLGVPIGALQGVAFPLSDVAIAVTGGRNLVYKAAWTRTYDAETRPEYTAMAYANAARVATSGTTISAHVQGGLGFTVEADASLFFLRAKGWSVLAGDPTRDLITVGAAVLTAAAS